MEANSCSVALILGLESAGDIQQQEATVGLLLSCCYTHTPPNMFRFETQTYISAAVSYMDLPVHTALTECDSRWSIQNTDEWSQPVSVAFWLE